MPAQPMPVMNLSIIEFATPRQRCEDSRHQNTDLEVLKAVIRAQLENLIRPKCPPADFAEPRV